MTERTETERRIDESVEAYRSGRMARRELLQRLAALTGGYAAAHMFLERSGLAAMVISTVEAQHAHVDADTVTYPSGEFAITGYLAKPRDAGKRPGVIVIHENRGLNEHIRDVTRRFAGEGFVALAPDLLSRLGGTGRLADEATDAIARLPIFGVIEDLKAAVDFLERHPSVEPTRIASVGFCWGGWRSFMLATASPRLHTAVVFYGSSPDSGFDRIHGSVLAHYAASDNRITGNAIWTKKMMDQAGKTFEYYVYPNTDHAFFNDTGNRHNPDASKLAWQRTLQFLRS